MKKVEPEAQEELLAALARDYRDARLTDLDRAILNYATKLTREPAKVTSDDVAQLRDQGLDDRGIHDLCAIVAYYAFVNRIADGLGVELESPG